MEFVNKKNILIASALLGIIPALYYINHRQTAITPNLIHQLGIDENSLKNDYYVGISPNSEKSTKEEYLAWLASEEKKVWHDVTALTGITYDECKKLVQEYLPTHAKETEGLKKQLSTGKEVAPHVREVIETVIHDLGCQPLEIISCTYPVAAATHGPIVLVNEEIFNTMPTLAQKFVVAHEISHIFLQDDEIRSVLRSKGFAPNEESLDYAINKLYRFQELRADMLAALTSLEYAKGYTEYVHNALGRRDNEEITELFYPTYVLRQTTSEKIQQIVFA